ncbi:VWA domain-containing protein [Deinococcus navajonensis]|uniref:VWA domain-containing protein n=1 Tax=Deinococcus navajonensis TaxID=309884 RepID=A0ABV8XS21_9DEIO
MNAMLRGFCVLLAAALSVGAEAAVCQMASEGPAPSSVTRYVFLVDTSASMEGAGGSPRIFSRVKSTLLQFTRTSPPGTQVQINTFNQGLTGTRRFTLPAEQAAFAAYVNSLRADGQKTYVNRALADTYKALRNQKDVNTLLYVLTDGRDNEYGSQRRLREFVRDYRLSRGAYDWLYYVTLGLPTPPDTREALGSLPNTRLLSSAPGRLPSLSLVTLQPGRLNLGNLQLAPSPQRDLSVRVQGQSQALHARVDSPDLERHGAFLSAELNQPQASRLTGVRFTLRNAESLPAGRYTATLCLEGPSTVILQPGALPLSFAYHPQARYRLERGGPARVDLTQGAVSTQTYQLRAENTWATDPVTLTVPTIEGLALSLNGAHSAEVKPGSAVALSLRNTGLPRNQPVQVALRVNAAGAEVAAPAPLEVVQPLTFLQRYGLWLALAVLLSLSLLAAYLNGRRPWGNLQSDEGPPRRLRGKQVDAARLLSNPLLSGLVLQGRAIRPTLAAIPAGLEVRIGRSLLEPGDPLEPDEAMTITRDGSYIDTLTYKKA